MYGTGIVLGTIVSIGAADRPVCYNRPAGFSVAHIPATVPSRTGSDSQENKHFNEHFA